MAVAQISFWSGQPETAIEYAEKTREQIPWHRQACNLLVQAYRQQGEGNKADEVSRQCRARFPSDLLL